MIEYYIIEFMWLFLALAVGMTGLYLVARDEVRFLRDELQRVDNLNLQLRTKMHVQNKEAKEQDTEEHY